MKMRFSGIELANIVGFLMLANGLGCQPSQGGGSPTPDELSPKKSVAKTIESPAVTLSPKAAEVIKNLISELKDPRKYYVRIEVVYDTGCKGFAHKLDLDPNTSAADSMFESEGLSLVVYQRQLEMLRGSLIDYRKTEETKGFLVQSPNLEGPDAQKWIALLEKPKDLK